MRRVVPPALLLIALTGAASTARADTFAPGSLIIPMDTTYQDNGMFKAFGLVYELLRNGVPVRWVIRQGKAYGGTDFTTSATDFATGAAIASHGYRGGPWVVDSADVPQAAPIIAAWQAANVTTVHQATVAFDGDVARLLVVAPSIAMFADGNQKIARTYLQAAGIPDSTLDPAWPDTSPDMLTPVEVAGPTTSNHHDGALFDSAGNPVYCQLMSMHWNVSDARAIPEVVAEVRSFLHYPVHFFAECQAVNAYENDLTNGLFLTPNGFVIGTTPTAVDFYNADSPFGQLDGAFKAIGGSEPAYSLPAGDTYKAGGITMITKHGTPEGDNDIWMTGYLDGTCPPNMEKCGTLGKVSYLGGHQYDVKLPISKNPTSQGTRLFLNSLFEAPCATLSGQPFVQLSKEAPVTTLSDSIVFTLSYSNYGPGIAMNAIVSDALPPGTSFVSATNGGTLANGKVTWSVGNLGVWQQGQVSFTVHLDGYASYSNQAVISYRVGLNDFDVSSNVTQTLYDKDTDLDGVPDAIDSCPNDYNPAQDLSTDPESCGTCGNVCAMPNAVPGCVSGVCVIAACDPVYVDCDGLVSNGCELPVADFDTDPSNCGGCGLTCSVAHGVAGCAAGTCVVASCDVGYADCDGLYSSGCEYATAGFSTDPKHCGSCTITCDPQTQVCTSGVCGPAICPAGTGDCLPPAGDCETDLETSMENCGACGLSCVLPDATGSCIGGQCLVSSCAPGFHDCNKIAADGCEVSDAQLQTDPANCGACGVSCAAPNATTACTAGLCAVTKCAAGYFDCNHVFNDGCELAAADLLTDPSNCGACGVVCAPANATGACDAGQCVIGSCLPGYHDLDGNPANGCEYACSASAATDTTCDGVDDDCNGLVDEGFVPPFCGVGACRAEGACVAGVVSCVPGLPSVEGPAGDTTCEDSFDNDCDGLTDSEDPDCIGVDAGTGGAAGAGGANTGGAAGAGTGGSDTGGAAGAGGTSTGGAAGAGTGGTSTGGTGGAQAGGAGGSNTGGSNTGGSGGGIAADSGTDGSASGAPGEVASNDTGGCSCSTPAGTHPDGRAALFGMAVALGLALRKRSRRGE